MKKIILTVSILLKNPAIKLLVISIVGKGRLYEWYKSKINTKDFEKDTKVNLSPESYIVYKKILNVINEGDQEK